MKYPLLVKKHVSFICNFLLTKVQYFFNRQYPEKLSRNPLRDAAFLLKKNNLVTNDTVSLPVPYAVCFSIYSHLSNMHNSCQKVFSFQCINAIFLENPVKMNIRRPRQTQGGARQGIILLTLVSDYYRSRRSSSNSRRSKAGLRVACYCEWFRSQVAVAEQFVAIGLDSISSRILAG